MLILKKHILLVLLMLISFCIFSMADSSENEDKEDDHHGEDVPSEEEPPKENEGKDDKKKEKKNKESDNNYDDESELSSNDIDKMFGGIPESTKAPANGAKPTTVEPPLGGFGSDFLEALAGSLSSSSTPHTPTYSTRNPNESTDDDSSNSEQEGSTEVPRSHLFFSYPRPIDIWDRLMVLAAFPICFLAILLKAQMLR